MLKEDPRCEYKLIIIRISKIKGNVYEKLFIIIKDFGVLIQYMHAYIHTCV